MSYSFTCCWCHEYGFPNVHSVNQRYLSMPRYTGRLGNRFQEPHGCTDWLHWEKEIHFL